jgi:putative transposase
MDVLSIPKFFGLFGTILQKGGKEEKMLKSFKYRIYPNKEQIERLQWVLDRCRELYNAALQERRDAYEIQVKRHPNYYDPEWRKQATKEYAISYYDQSAQMSSIRDERCEYRDIPIAILRDPLQRVHRAFKGFFDRVKKGKTPGYPRFQGKNRYDSFGYVQAGGFSLEGNRVKLNFMDSIKVKLHRPVEGKIKTCRIKREGAHWYVTFACEVQAEKLPVSYEDVGIDLGLLHFATLSDGSTIENPRYYRKGQKKLEKLQQSLSSKKRGSHRRQKAVKQVANAHRKVRNQRKDFLHKESHKLVNRYQVIVFEELQPANLVKRPKPKQDETTGQYLPNGAAAKGGLNKSINDAGWDEFVQMCTSKAEEAGRTILQVNPKFTSQICSGCGTVRKKELSERWHSCECGTELDRDHNAALNILRLGQRLQAQAC